MASPRKKSRARRAGVSTYTLPVTTTIFSSQEPPIFSPAVVPIYYAEAVEGPSRGVSQPVLSSPQKIIREVSPHPLDPDDLPQRYNSPTPPRLPAALEEDPTVDYQPENADVAEAMVGTIHSVQQPFTNHPKLSGLHSVGCAGDGP